MGDKWVIKEIYEELKVTRELFVKWATKSDEEARRSQPAYKTDDKFEASRHEFWRGKATSYRDAVCELDDLLERLDDISKEELEDAIRLLEEAEDFDRDQRRLPW